MAKRLFAYAKFCLDTKLVAYFMTKNRIIKSKEGHVLGRTKMNQVSKTTALSLSEANIQVAEHMAAVMYFYFSETDATPEEEEEFYEITLNLAALMAQSMNINVTEVREDNEIVMTAKLEDVDEFLEEMLGDN